jgi:protein-disulfide isomerase
MKRFVYGFSVAFALVSFGAPAFAAKGKVTRPTTSLGKRSSTGKVFSWHLDYQCPGCRGLGTSGIMEKIVANGHEVDVRMFPLVEMHPDAHLAAQAAMAAAAQGKFPEMHAKLVSGGIDRKSLSEHAQAIGLDVERFNTELDGGHYSEVVDDDMAAGAAMGVHGTPTFSFKGQVLPGISGVMLLGSLLQEPAGK